MTLLANVKGGTPDPERRRFPVVALSLGTPSPSLAREKKCRPRAQHARSSRQHARLLPIHSRHRRARPRPLTPDRYFGAELESQFAEAAKSETAERAILANLKFPL